MKAIILLFSFLVFMGCDNQFSQDSTVGLSKQCQLFDMLDYCEGSSCEGYLQAIPMVGTKYEWIVDEALKGWSFQVISAEVKERYTEEDAKEIQRIIQEWALNLPIKPPELSKNENIPLDLRKAAYQSQNDTWLLRVRKHLNCPPPLKKPDNL